MKERKNTNGKDKKEKFCDRNGKKERQGISINKIKNQRKTGKDIKSTLESRTCRFESSNIIIRREWQINLLLNRNWTFQCWSRNGLSV